MNGNYYNQPYQIPKQNDNSIYNQYTNDLYIENILKNNTGKKATIQITIPTSSKYSDQTFEGIIENSGKDHIILSNPQTGQWYLIPIIYIDFITFEEPINQNRPFYN